MFIMFIEICNNEQNAAQIYIYIYVCVCVCVCVCTITKNVIECILLKKNSLYLLVPSFFSYKKIPILTGMWFEEFYR